MSYFWSLSSLPLYPSLHAVKKNKVPKFHNICNTYTRDKLTITHTHQIISNANKYHTMGLPLFSISTNLKALVGDHKRFFITYNVGLGEGRKNIFDKS